MRFTKYLVLPAVTMLLLSAGSVPLKIMKLDTLTIYGPFSDLEEQYFNFTIQTDLPKITGMLRLYDHSTGALKVNRSITFINGKSNTVEVETGGRLTNSGLGIRVEIYTNGTELFNEYTPIFPPSCNTKTVINDVFINEGICYGIKDNKVVNKEKYDFSNSNNNVTANTFCELDLSEYEFGYYPSNKYTYQNAFLEITDNENIYPNIEKFLLSKTIKIPLILVENDGEITFEYNINMWVNKNTLDMSSRKIKGYVMTDRLYIPVSRLLDFEKNEIKVVIEGSGFNQDKINIPLDYFYNNKHFGSCDSSDICVQGGIKE